MTDLCEYWDKGILIKAKLGKIFQTEETVISEGCYDQIVDLTYKNSLEIKKISITTDTIKNQELEADLIAT